MAPSAMASIRPALAPVIPSFDGLRLDQQAQMKFHVPCGRQSSTRRFEIFAQKKVVKRRQIILLQDVEHLGKSGELVSVKAGYFRNYLFPYSKAKMATPDFLKELKLEEERKEAEKLKIKEEAEALARRIQNIGGFTVRRKKGMIGKQIFGSVTTQDLADIMQYNLKQEVDKRMITIPEIRELGQYLAEIKLHPEVTIQVKVFVIAQ